MLKYVRFLKFIFARLIKQTELNLNIKKSLKTPFKTSITLLFYLGRLFWNTKKNTKNQ